MLYNAMAPIDLVQKVFRDRQPTVDTISECCKVLHRRRGAKRFAYMMIHRTGVVEPLFEAGTKTGRLTYCDIL